jgi:hypothetical protein
MSTPSVYAELRRARCLKRLSLRRRERRHHIEIPLWVPLTGLLKMDLVEPCTMTFVINSAGISAGVIAVRSFQSRVSGRAQETRPARVKKKKRRKVKTEVV